MQPSNFSPTSRQGSTTSVPRDTFLAAHKKEWEHVRIHDNQPYIHSEHNQTSVAGNLPDRSYSSTFSSAMKQPPHLPEELRAYVKKHIRSDYLERALDMTPIGYQPFREGEDRDRAACLDRVLAGLARIHNRKDIRRTFARRLEKGHLFEHQPHNGPILVSIEPTRQEHAHNVVSPDRWKEVATTAKEAIFEKPRASEEAYLHFVKASEIPRSFHNDQDQFVQLPVDGLRLPVHEGGELKEWLECFNVDDLVILMLDLQSPLSAADKRAIPRSIQALALHISIDFSDPRSQREGIRLSEIEELFDWLTSSGFSRLSQLHLSFVELQNHTLVTDTNAVHVCGAIECAIDALSRLDTLSIHCHGIEHYPTGVQICETLGESLRKRRHRFAKHLAAQIDLLSNGLAQWDNKKTRRKQTIAPQLTLIVELKEDEDPDDVASTAREAISNTGPWKNVVLDGDASDQDAKTLVDRIEREFRKKDPLGLRISSWPREGGSEQSRLAPVCGFPLIPFARAIQFGERQ